MSDLGLNVNLDLSDLIIFKSIYLVCKMNLASKVFKNQLLKNPFKCKRNEI